MERNLIWVIVVLVLAVVGYFFIVPDDAVGFNPPSGSTPDASVCEEWADDCESIRKYCDAIGEMAKDCSKWLWGCWDIHGQEDACWEVYKDCQANVIYHCRIKPQGGPSS